MHTDYIYLADQLQVVTILYFSATIWEQAVMFNVFTLQCIRTLRLNNILVMMIQDILTGIDFCIKQEIRSNMNIYKSVELVKQQLAHFSLNKHLPKSVFTIFTLWYSRFHNLEYHVTWQVVTKRSAPSGLLRSCVVSQGSTDLIYYAAEAWYRTHGYEVHEEYFCSSLQIMWFHNQKDPTTNLSHHKKKIIFHVYLMCLKFCF